MSIISPIIEIDSTCSINRLFNTSQLTNGRTDTINTNIFDSFDSISWNMASKNFGTTDNSLTQIKLIGTPKTRLLFVVLLLRIRE